MVNVFVTDSADLSQDVLMTSSFIPDLNSSKDSALFRLEETYFKTLGAR